MRPTMTMTTMTTRSRSRLVSLWVAAVRLRLEQENFHILHILFFHIPLAPVRGVLSSLVG